MSKSALVMDTPKKCDSCMYVGTFYDFCKINYRYIEDLSTKPDWCPLNPLSEKMTGVAQTNRSLKQHKSRLEWLH